MLPLKNLYGLSPAIRLDVIDGFIQSNLMFYKYTKTLIDQIT